MKEDSYIVVNDVKITHPDKLLFPEARVTKGMMAVYYAMIAKYMLPHIKNRPLSLKQYPEGITKTGFFHKHAAGFYPESIPVFKIAMHKEHGKIDMVGAATAQDLVYMAGQNAIEFHIPTATVKHISKPDQIILDYDPSDNDFEKVRALAFITRDILTDHKMQSFVKTTGNRGVHVHIPIQANRDYDEVKPIAKELATAITQQAPDLATTELRKNKRGNKVFIDYLRNDYGMTAVAPYSLRANKAAGVATPISWDELKKKSLQPDSFTIHNIEKRVKNFKDPWSKYPI